MRKSIIPYNSDISSPTNKIISLSYSWYGGAFSHPDGEAENIQIIASKCNAKCLQKSAL